MEYAAVTVENMDGRRRDLALPVTVRSQELAQAVARALELPPEGAYQLALKKEGELHFLPPKLSLADAGILSGANLALQVKDAEASEITGGASFLTGSNDRLMITGDSITIGRSDPGHGIFADIDLSSYDPRKYTSRRHALLERTEQGYLLADVGSSHGVFVNGKRLEPQEKHPLHHGDVVEFGLASKGGVRLIFQNGSN